MLKLIIGLKGSGKTKQLIELANKAVEVSPGHVVCVEKSNKLIFDVNHKVRLVDTEAYGVANAEELYGLAKAVGYELNVANLYESGCPVKDHWTWLNDNSRNYDLCVTSSSTMEQRSRLRLKREARPITRRQYRMLLTMQSRSLAATGLGPMPLPMQKPLISPRAALQP